MPFDEFLAIADVIPSQIPVVPVELHRTTSPQVEEAHPNRQAGTALRLPPNRHFVPSSMPMYCVQRRSPLICANQELVMQLAAIRRARELDGDNRSALSYARAIAVRKVSLHVRWKALNVTIEPQR
jgi:hypothetical protein